VSPVLIRDSREADVPALAAIYGHWVLHGLASFELEPPGAAETAWRRGAVLDGGYPYLVAEDRESGRVLGYAYVGAYRSRPAYRFTVEDSVYVAPDAGRRGVGRSLLAELLGRLEALGLRQVIAVIGDSGNVPSIGLHVPVASATRAFCRRWDGSTGAGWTAC
jgi:L-amino acid N-acyltransferase YncA